MTNDMNERIQQLADQAGWIYVGNSRVPNMKKFAELQIRECAEVADNNDTTREKWQGIGKFVREHFGVEE